MTKDRRKRKATILLLAVLLALVLLGSFLLWSFLPEEVRQGEAVPPAAPAEEPAPAASKGKEITSPLVGVFHSLSEGKAVKIGDKLKKGDIVCMVEAMKLMNEITMPEDGEITWVACEEGGSVEYGQLLYNYV